MLTNYPNGITSFGVPVMGGGVEIPASTGNYFFVHSGTGSDAYDGKNPKVVDRSSGPFATVDYAIGKCTASNGDVVIVMPGHAETLTAAVTVDVAGVQVIGLGPDRFAPGGSRTDRCPGPGDRPHRGRAADRGRGPQGDVRL